MSISTYEQLRSLVSFIAQAFRFLYFLHHHHLFSLWDQFKRSLFMHSRRLQEGFTFCQQGCASRHWMNIYVPFFCSWMNWWECIAYYHRICGGISAVAKPRPGAPDDLPEQGKRNVQSYWCISSKSRMSLQPISLIYWWVTHLVGWW